MQTPSIPDTEEERQRELDAANILDTAPEAEFDELTQSVARQLNMPIALVSLVDRDRQWFKSRHGLEACETGRDVSFCGHVVADGKPLVVKDAFQDPRFADNPLVVGDPKVRFYAGFPLRTSAGHVLGTLCVIDHEPRTLTDEDLRFAESMAQLASKSIELRIAANARQQLAFSNSLHRLIESLQREFIDQGSTSYAWWRKTLDGIIALTGSEYGFIASVESDDESRYIRTHAITDISWSEETRRLYADNQARGMIFRNPNSLFGRVFMEGRTLVANDVEHDPRASGRPSGHPPLRRFLGLACGQGDQMIAMIGLANRAEEYTPELVADLEPAAQFVASTVTSAHNIAKRRAAETRLNAVVDRTLDAVITINERGTILAVNPALETIFGYAPDEVTGQNVSMLMNAHERDAHDGFLEHYRETGEKHIIGSRRNLPARRKDGSQIWVDLAVSEVELDGVRCFTGILRDITAQVADHQKLNDSATRLVAALEMAKAGSWEYDFAHDRFTLNDTFYKVLGTSAEAVGTLNLTAAQFTERFVYPEDAPLIAVEMRRAQESKELSYARDIEHRFVAPDGRVGQLYVRIFGVREAGQPLKGIFGVVQDVSVYRSAEQARARAEEQERLNQVLAERIRELDHSQRVSALTSECVELVQRCVSLDEGIELTSRFLARMYPDVRLSLYIKSDVNHDLTLHSCSGHGASLRPRQLLDPAECWGLRTRRVYVASPHSTHLTCRHLMPDPNDSGRPATSVDVKKLVTVCAPLLSLDKLIGLVSMTLDPPQDDDERERIKRAVAQFETTMQSLGGALSTISLRESLQRLALVDELTSLPNRRAFLAALQKHYHRAQRTSETFTLAILDVDHFKRINDTRGHDEGDRVLRQLAELALAFFRTEDSVGRMGGEEFGIMLVGISPSDAFKRLDAFRTEVSQRCRVGQDSVYVSIGFACSGGENVSSMDTLMLAADAALYDAKRNGRNRVVVAPLCAALVDGAAPP